MKYNFLFHSKEHEEAFFNNLDSLIVHIDRSLGAEKFKMNQDEMKEYMNNNENNVFVIRENNNIVGGVFTNVYDFKSNNTKRLFIRGLAIDEKYKGKGYSKKLMKKAFNWGTENGAINSMLWIEKIIKLQ